MKKITTTLEKEIEYYKSIFTKEEVEQCFNVLVDEHILVKADNGEYEINQQKMQEIIDEYGSIESQLN